MHRQSSLSYIPGPQLQAEDRNVATSLSSRCRAQAGAKKVAVKEVRGRYVSNQGSGQEVASQGEARISSATIQMWRNAEALARTTLQRQYRHTHLEARRFPFCCIKAHTSQPGHSAFNFRDCRGYHVANCFGATPMRESASKWRGRAGRRKAWFWSSNCNYVQTWKAWQVSGEFGADLAPA